MVFDPYHHWLGIPPSEQPPHHYRLLGIAVFEPDGDVICNAADRQMAHLRTFQTSKHAAESQRLLNEVAAARLCLLDSARRSAYDVELRLRLTKYAPPTGHVPVPPPVPIAANPVTFTASPVVHPVRGRRRKNAANELFKIVLGGLVGCAVALAILWYGFQLDPIGWRGLLDADPAQKAADSAPLDSRASEVARASKSRSSPPSRSGDARSTPSAEKQKTNDGRDRSAQPNEDQGGDRGADTKPGDVDMAESPPAESQRPKVAKNVSDPFEPPARNRPRVAVPPADAQTSTLAVLDELYKLDALRLRSDKQQLARTLLAAAGEATASDVERFVLLRKAAESAADAGDAPLVKRALDSLGESFELDIANAHEKLLLRTLENVRDESAMDEFVPISQKVVFEFVSQNRLDSALRLTEATYAACLKPAGKRHRKFVYDGQVALRKLHQSWAQAEEAREAIERGEGTPEHRRALGRFLCLQRGEWDEGLPYLAQTDDAAIRAAAERDLSRPSDAALRIQLADQWYDVAKGAAVNEGFAVRSAHWYELAQGSVTGLVKTKVAMRIEEMRDAVRDIDQRELSAAGLARQAKP